MRFVKKHWPAILGVVLQGPSLWNLILSALDWRGRFDSLVAIYHDVGGYSVVIGFILSPPSWFYPVAFGIGLILIWWDFNVRSHKVNEQWNEWTETREKLQQFYVEVGPIITRGIPRNISDTDFNNYIGEAEAWATNAANWIGTNMGIPARERFLDRTGMLTLSYSSAVNGMHNVIINNLTKLRKNILALIESGAWDKR